MSKHPTQSEDQMPQDISLAPGLYLVATPIGNLRDITLRALDVLRLADVILCEDTRVTAKLRNAYGISTPMQTYHDHSTGSKRRLVLDKISSGQVVALVSDAGMPLVSDPGFKLVRDALSADIMVTSVPGANAVLTGLQLSGLPSDKFSFLGFLSAKTKARQQELLSWKDVPGTLLYYESSKRLIESLQDVHSVLGDRSVAVLRELTKRYEEGLRGLVSELIEDLGARPDIKGELVVVIGPADEVAVSEEELKQFLKEALQTHSVRDAVAQVSAQTGVSRKQVYTLALMMDGEKERS